MENKNKPYLVPIAIIIAGILIAGAVYYRGSAPASNQEKANNTLATAKSLLTKMTPVSPTEHILGSAQAPFTLVEYSDLECPFCKAFHQTTNNLNEKYITTGKLALVFRHFPLDIHPKATTEAGATECVAKLGGNEKFWQYLDKIFVTTPSNNKLDLALLPQFAEELGIDKAKFEACLADDSTKKLIADQIQKGLDIGVNGTPFVVMIGPKGEKILPFYEPAPSAWGNEAKQIIDDMLADYDTQINKLRQAQAQ